MESKYFIFSAGQKIKQARYELNIVQKQLENEHLSLAMIKQLETNRTAMNPFYAKNIVDRILQLETDLNKYLPYSFTVEYLLEDVQTQVANIINELFGKLKNIKFDINAFTDALDSCEKLFAEYEVNDNLKIEVFKQATEFYKANNAKDLAEKYAIKTIKLYTFKNDENNILLMQSELIRIYRNAGEYKDVIKIVENLELTSRFKKHGEYENICYNAALSYYCLEQFPSCLEWLDNINFENLTVSKKLDILNLKANLLIKEKKLDEAKEKYLTIIDESIKNGISVFLTSSYGNISEIYRLKGDYKNALVYMDKSLEQPTEDKLLVLLANFNAFLLHMELSNTEKIAYYFHTTLNYALEQKRVTTEEQLMDKFLEYCIENHHINLLKEAIKEFDYLDCSKYYICTIYTKCGEYLNDNNLIVKGLSFVKKDGRNSI